MTQERENSLSGSVVSLRMMIIGDLSRWQAEGRNTASFDSIEFVTLDELTADLLDKAKPEVILSPLVADTFDAFDVASHLVDLGFKGRYRAIAGPTSDPKIILAEVQTIAPDLDFDLLELK